MSIHAYYVTGPGQFPDDMLRYDQARIVQTIQRADRTFYHIVGQKPPTIGRWQSFLWIVVETAEQCARWDLSRPAPF